jgi:phosphatidate phosphatase PAH1
MLDALEAQKSIETKVQKQKLEESEKSLHDWSTVFEKKPPSGIKKTILQSEDRIKQLEEELRIEKINHSAAESSMLKIVQQHHESSRNTLEQTVKHLNEKIEDLNRTWKEKYEELEIKYKNRLKKKEKHIDSPKVQN